MRKRIISLLLTCVIVFSMISPVSAGTLLTEDDLFEAVLAGSIDEESYNIYLAWYHTIMNAEGRDSQLEKYCDTMLYNSFAELYQKEVVRSALMMTWAGIGDKIQRELKEEDLYSALLYKSILGETGNSTSFEVFDAGLLAGDFLTPLLEELSNILNVKENELVAKLAFCDWNQYDGVIEAIEKTQKTGKNISQAWENIGGLTEILSGAVATAKNIVEVKERIYQINAILEADDKLKSILFEMLSDTNSDLTIRMAANDLYEYMLTEDYEERLKQVICNEIAKGTKHVAGDVYGFILSDVLSQLFPTLAIGKAAVDILFDMSGEGESIYVILCLGEMEDAIFRAAKKISNKFKATQTTTTAYEYITAMDMCHRFAMVACDYTDDHLKTMYESGVIKELITNQENYNTYKQILAKNRNHIAKVHQEFYTIPKELFDKCLEKINSKYIVTYNANGGTDAPASHENTEGPTELSTTVPTRTGFTFLGWDENPNVKEPTYRKTSDGSPIVIDKEGSVKLYAIWQAGTFDIVFHANGGTYADNSDSKTMQKTYLQSFTVNPEIPTREGYVFSGYWTLNADGSGTQYTQGKTYSDIGGAGLSAKHLYAHWTKVKTEVIFRYDYTNCTYTDITIPLTNGSASITLIDPPAEKIAEIGKEFVQWKYYYPDGSGCEYYQTGDTITLTDNMTLYAEWANPASGTILSVLTDKTSYLPGDTVEISITADNSGYFTVDASDNAGFIIKNAEGGKTASGVFVENSSESTSTNLKCYDNGSAYTVMLYIPNNCSDGAYTVDIVASNGTYGVNGAETSAASETITITVDTSEEEVASYILSYNLNGGYGTIPNPEYFEENDHVGLADDSGFQRDGYEFGGWSMNSDGSGKTYKAGRDYQFTESTLLYAIWEPVTADADELSLALGVERYSKVYKPGETAHIIVSPDNSDHFFIDVSDCAGFTVLSAMGTKLTEATYIEYSSPAFISDRDGYTDGSNKYIPVYIPSNCKDGQYTFFVTATDGILDQTTGEKMKCSVTIYVRESDTPDSIQLSKSEITLHVGDGKRLKATVEPQHIFNHYNQKDVTWKTSDKNVASIDDKGNSVDISGVRSGTATITATVDGISASCTVTVVRCDYYLKVVEPEYLASAATCEKQAEYYYVCSCGDVGSVTYKVGELADHNYSDWTVLQQATETTVGIEQRVCSACGGTEERSIPATGTHTPHMPGTAWYFDAKKHWHICSIDGCTVKLNEDTHNFGEISVETPATETNTGIGYRTCGSCGYTQSVEIPVLSSTLYAVLITDGTGGGLYAPGTQVTISADVADTDKQFKSWIGLDEVIIVSGSVTSTTVTFVMPAKAVNVCAAYEDSSDVPQTNSVLVFYGSGDGSYEVGETVTIKADKFSGTFQYWEVLSSNVSLKNANAESTTFIMPANDVELRAVCSYDGADEIGGSETYYVFGKITSFTSGGYYKVTFLNEQGQEHTYSYGKRACFEILGVAPGTYTLRVSKSKHITQEYTIVVEGDVIYNVALPLEPTVTVNVSSISQKGTTIQINAISAGVVGGNIVVAIYDGYNKMMDVQIFDAVETIEALISVNGAYVKIMWIASLKSCIPVCGAISVEI